MGEAESMELGVRGSRQVLWGKAADVTDGHTACHVPVTIATVPHTSIPSFPISRNSQPAL